MTCGGRFAHGYLTAGQRQQPDGADGRRQESARSAVLYLQPFAIFCFLHLVVDDRRNPTASEQGLRSMQAGILGNLLSECASKAARVVRRVRKFLIFVVAASKQTRCLRSRQHGWLQTMHAHVAG